MEHSDALPTELSRLVIKSARMNNRTVEEEVLSSAKTWVDADFLRLALHKHQPISDNMRRFLETLSASDNYLTRPVHAQTSSLNENQIPILFSWLSRYLNRTNDHGYWYSWEDYLEDGPHGYRMPDYLRQVVLNFLADSS